MIQDLFYFAELQQSMENSHIDLPNDEAKHLFVRRYKVNDKIQLFNGVITTRDNKGLTAEGIITELSKNKARVEISTINATTPPKIRITIASALPKNDRTHTMLDMATQSGMTDFVPLSCVRSVTKMKPNDKNNERLHKYLIESCKQCRRLNVPQLHLSASVNDLLMHKQPNTLYLFAEETGHYLTESHINASTINGIDNIMIFIGPEGGFANNELTLLSDNATKIKLSNAILRTETATTLAAAMVNALIDSAMN